MSDLLVLCYHGVSSGWRSPYSVTPERLDAQVRALLRRGYRPATVSAAARPGAGKLLAVTFDDALRSVRSHAFDVLAELDVPATVFACTAHVGRDTPMAISYERWIGGPHEGELVSLGWDDLAVLHDAGWEIGSHTRTHPRLPGLADAPLREELEGSREDVERRLGACTALAYPHGAVDDRVVAAARAAGYAAACTATAGVRAGDALRLPRAVVLQDDGPARLRVKTSRLARGLRASPLAWRALAPLHRAAGGGHRGPA